MKLKRLIIDINKQIVSSINEISPVYEDIEYVFPCGIECKICLYDNNECSCTIEGKELPNLKSFVENSVLSYDDAIERFCESNEYEDMWKSHGFRDEVDYNSCRYIA